MRTEDEDRRRALQTVEDFAAWRGLHFRRQDLRRNFDALQFAAGVDFPEMEFAIARFCRQSDALAAEDARRGEPRRFVPIPAGGIPRL